MIIKLVNMPFGHVAMPSLALTQLKAILDQTFGHDLDVEILYLNMEIVQIDHMPPLYDHVLSHRGLMTGIGDWLFRDVAFPDAPDNTDAYLNRYCFEDSSDSAAVRAFAAGPRRHLADVLDELVEHHQLDQADVVGFTTLFAQTVPSAALAQRIKRANTDVVTLLGGAACEGVIGQELARQLDAIDYVFTGPALSSLPELVRHLIEQESGVPFEVAGVCSKNRDANRITPPVHDHAWEQLPPPDYTDFLATLHRRFPGGSIVPALLFQTSEGCWWGDKSECSFCGLNAEACRFHTMTPERAVEQFGALLKQGGETPFFMAVDSIMPERYPREVFTRIAAPEDGCIQYEVRPTLDAEEIRTLSEAGVRLLQPGIEALATSTLKLMKKGLTAFQNIRFLKQCSSHPITLRWNLLLFSPGEDEATYEKYLQDIPRLAHLHPPEGAFPVNFVRNSRYLADPEAFGLNLEPQDFYALTYPADPDALLNLANVFIDRGADVSSQDAWLTSMNAAVDRWDARYFGSDGQPQARLVMFKEGERSGIYDSRGGNETRYWLDSSSRDLLLYLEEPRREAEIVSTFGDIGQGLNELRNRALLFEEGGRMMSLVLPSA
ncbi:MAG: RiPP maturation radical SAM C-methyltransferase [Kiritimatiellae bacterium]|nr:RiPP maturation radical SAM C-methyltransferase [Kiritimatiellia bacterium]